MVVGIPSIGQQSGSAAHSSIHGEIIFLSAEAARVEELNPDNPITESGIVPGEESNPETNVMAPSTRLKYKQFKGTGRQDVDDWYGEFESTALANEESPESKQRIFQGLLKGEALKWYQDLTEAEQKDWEELIPQFLRTFRESGGEARALGRLSQISMKSGESVRKYGQRVKSLIQKVTSEIAANVQIEWYLRGLPNDMGFTIRQTRPITLREAMEAAQNYENSVQSIREKLRRKDKKCKKKEKRSSRRRKDYSESDESGSSSRSENSGSDPESSDLSEKEEKLRKPTHGRDLRAERSKMLLKVKKEDEDSKMALKGIQETLEAIRVNLAENRRPRKTIPVVRANVWCTRCGESGHFASECTRKPGRLVQYVNPQNGVYYTVMEEEDEEEEHTAYQVQSGYGRGKGFPSPPPRQNAYPRLGMGSTSHEMFLQPRPLVICYVCGNPGHYANNCPYRGAGQGAPLPLPCQNCGVYGHDETNCTRPLIPKQSFKPVENPTREQSGLNYGHTVGTEKPDK